MNMKDACFFNAKEHSTKKVPIVCDAISSETIALLLKNNSDT